MGKLVLGLSPLVIFAGLWFGDPRTLALLLLALIVLQNLRLAKRFVTGLPPSERALFALPALLAVAVALTNSEPLLLLYPAAVSSSMLILFGWSLIRPPSVIERIARLSEPTLTPAGVRYTRSVTLVWCAFFVFNGAIAAYTALQASREAWALYNGLVAYLLMGVLFMGERLVRPVLLARS
jgi:uncharacterized membrane protein